MNAMIRLQSTGFYLYKSFSFEIGLTSSILNSIKVMVKKFEKRSNSWVISSSSGQLVSNMSIVCGITQYINFDNGFCSAFA
jgi:hypothetical protein